MLETLLLLVGPLALAYTLLNAALLLGIRIPAEERALAEYRRSQQK